MYIEDILIEMMMRKRVYLNIFLSALYMVTVNGDLGLMYDDRLQIYNNIQLPPTIPFPNLPKENRKHKRREKRQGLACKHNGKYRKTGEEWDHFTTETEGKDTYYGFKMTCNDGKVSVLGCLETELFVPLDDKRPSNVYDGYDITCSKKGFDYVASKHKEGGENRNSEFESELDLNDLIEQHLNNDQEHPRHRRQAGTKECGGHKLGEEYNKGFYKYECTATGPKAIKCIDLGGKEYGEGDEYDVIKTYRMKCFKTDDGWVVEAIACIDSTKALVDIGATQRGGWYQRTCLEKRSEKGTQTAVALNITHCCELNTDHCVAVDNTEPSVAIKDFTFACIKEGNEYFYRYYGEDGQEVDVDDARLEPTTTAAPTTPVPTTTTVPIPPATTPDPCDPNPCVHGTCTGEPLCTCDPGWMGEKCDDPIDECQSSPCANGKCIDGEQGYTCECEPGFTGVNCDEEINNCESSPCLHGNCIEGETGYMCECDPGFTGVNCDEDIDECASSPCNAGQCRDDINGYNCVCDPGFQGPNCDQEIDRCLSSPCQNGGACIDGADGYTCECIEGFTGTNCETAINECASSPCANGNCIDGHNSYTCICDNGYTGKYCEQEIDPCPSQPCQNGGDCIKVGPNKFTCECREGWQGKYCEERVPSNCEDERWVEHDDHCYYASDLDDRKNASDAAKDCWENDAHLLVVNNQLEWEFIQGELDQKRFVYPAMAQDGFWVGLTLDVDWRWVRPEGMLPIPWLSAERRFKRQVDELKKCGEVKWDLRQWGMDKDHCSHKQWFICEKYKDGEPIPNFVTQPPVEAERCANGWLKHEDHCYMVSNEPKNSNDAEKYCEDAGSHLVVIDDRFEWDFVEREAMRKAQVIPDQGFDGYWIGYSLDDQNNWAWIREGGMQSVPWLPFDLRNLARQFGPRLSCGDIRYDYRQWGVDKDHCVHEQGFICEMEPEQPDMDKPMVEPTECQRGWMSYQNQCYYVSNPREREDFPSAADACRSMGAQILTMFNDDEWDYVRSTLERVKSLYPGQGLDGFWIGLQFDASNTQWHWTDVNGMSQIPWMTGSSHQDDTNSNSPQRKCGEMRYMHSQWGVDNDHCSHRQWYICVDRPYQQPPYEQPPYEQPGYGSNGLKCPVGWDAYEGHCYFYSPPGSYIDVDEAKATCAAEGSHLAIAENMREWSFLINEASRRGATLSDKGFDGFWIGLMKNEQSNTWEWNNGKIADQVPWVAGNSERFARQSRQYGSATTCGEVRWDIDKWGADKDHCLHKQGYICEMEPQKQPGDCRDPDHQCPLYSSECTLTGREYRCVCRLGYHGDGNTCTDVDECTSTFSNPCGTGAWCQNTPGSFKCYCTAGYKGDPPRIPCTSMGLCVTYGDPHFRGFDDSTLHYQGTCRYVLAQTQHIARDSPTFFSVEAQGETRYGVHDFSWTSDVYITAYGHTFGLHKDSQVSIDGIKISIPTSLMNNTIDISRNNVKDVMFKSKAGIEVMYDGDSRAEVYVPSTYRQQIRGICGNYDGDPNNDRMAPSGGILRHENEFGDSWIAPGGQVAVQCDEKTPRSPACTPGQSKYRDSENFCQPLTDEKGPFTNCYRLIGIDPNEYFKSCAIDVCVLGPEQICNQFKILSDMCAEKGLVIRNWRAFLGCTMENDCKENEEYETCGPGCEETCASIFVQNPQPCPYQCEEGCFCKDGYVRSQGTCIPKANCGCSIGTKHMQAGDVYFKDRCTQMCTCEAFGNRLQPVCSPGRCDQGVCSRDGSVEACVCPTGFSGNGTHCLDLNECVMLDTPCKLGQACVNTAGSYKCSCDAGYEHNPVTGACEDIDECRQTSLICGDIVARCFNLPGTYTCTCPPGFIMVYVSNVLVQPPAVDNKKSTVKCVSAYQFFSGKTGKFTAQKDFPRRLFHNN